MPKAAVDQNPSERLDAIIAIASAHHLVELCYRKRLTDEKLEPRIVECYSLTDGRQDVMVRGYQLEPGEGWRFFMAHKIARVVDTGREFEPRREITLHTKRVTKSYEKAPGWTDATEDYRDLIADALADGKVTREEMARIDKCKADHALTMDQVLFVHATLFHRCLGAILEDGLIDDGERAEIRFLNKVLSRLGWTISD